MTRPLLLAHRGDHRAAPENSLEAFRAAVHAGLDGVELDVRASRDGEAVVLHDETLARVQGVPARASALRAVALGELGVPRLADVFETVPDELLVDVELKEPVVEATVDAIRRSRGSVARNVVLSSFDESILGHVAEIAPSWPRWLISTDRGALRTALLLGCTGLALQWQAIDRDLVDQARAAGLRVIAWTIRDLPSLALMRAYAVDAVCVEGDAIESREVGHVGSDAVPARGVQRGE